jgi:CRP-like cAMP-binding protein
MFFETGFFVRIRVDLNRRNSILHSLPSAEWNLLKADLKSVELPKGAVLFEPDRSADFTYFPSDSVISFLGDTGEGGSVEVWSVGNEGVCGVLSLFGGTKPFRGIVQVPGMAFVAKTSSLRRHFQRGGAFHNQLLRYYDYLLVQISYLGICNNNHSIEERFIRWLLMIGDRAGTKQLKFTQDAIAAILGTRRATISVAAAALQSQGLISYSPGAIKIESRRGLEKAACRCYEFINSTGYSTSGSSLFG